MAKHDGKLNILNMKEFSAIGRSPVAQYKSRYKINSVQLKRFSHEDKHAELHKSGVHLDITSPEIFVNGKKPIDGIFSSFFGADTTKDAPVFTCDCHNITDGTKRGQICPLCGTAVRTIEADLRTCLYVDIAPFHILTYHGYNGFAKLFGKSFHEKIKNIPRINVPGHVVREDGAYNLLSLYEDYSEYESDLGIPRDIAFTSKIPVYSARLRPLMHQNKKMTILDDNQRYLSIVRIKEDVLDASKYLGHLKRDTEILRGLVQIQTDFIEICGSIMDQIKGKGGSFRKSLASGRLDYTSRMVISAGPYLKAHEVDCPYQTIMILFEEEIANYLSRLEDIPQAQAISLVEQNITKRSELFVQIINQMIKSKKGLWVLVNRNPSISESAILYMRIRQIHEDDTDLTLHLPSDVLALIGADFDGDQVSLAAVKNPTYHELFMSMCPTYAFIDRCDGSFNRGMNIQRDYAAVVTAAWDIDRAYDRYLSNPDEDTHSVVEAFGFDSVADLDEDTVRKRDELIDNIINSNVDSPYSRRFTQT